MLTLPTRSAPPRPAIDPDAPAVRCIGISKHFGASAAVTNATIELKRGSILALLGPSGGGKTTALRMIAGFETPDEGVIEVEGIVVQSPKVSLPPEERRVGMVFQDYALFPHMNVRDNVGFGLKKNDHRDHCIGESLEMVGLTGSDYRMPHELSGGQQQRVALARALAPNPAVILMDEPFSNLDAALRDKVRTEVKQILRDAGASAIFVTHDQDEAFGLTDVVSIMLGSTIVQTGSPADVYVNPATMEVARFLGENNILDGDASDGWVDCELGHLPLVEGARLNGPVKVAVRPESIRLNPDAGSSVLAQAVDREFRGIYQLVHVRLPSGVVLTAVMGLHIPVEIGGPVPIGVNSTVAAFPSS
jgi:iron(III) transport system ATP-binding protein